MHPVSCWCAMPVTRRGFGFFREYLKDAAATEAAWEGGWFHTGDLVTRDALGYFRFVDRKKNVIRRSGENISAVEVESVLAQHPAVRAVGITAVPDEVRGDEVFACVVPVRGGCRCGSAGERARRLLPRATRVLQGAGLRRRRAGIAPDADGKDPESPAQGAGGRAAGAWRLSRRARTQTPGQRMSGAVARRQDYAGVAVAVPVTVPYVKYSIRSAHWFVARALSGAARESRDREGRDRRRVHLEFHALSRYRRRADAASRARAALARPHPDGRCQRHRRAASRRARGPGWRCRDRRVHRRRYEPHRHVPADASRVSASLRATRSIPTAREDRTRVSHS